MDDFFESSDNILWLDLLQLCVALASLILNGILILANLRRGIWRWETDGILMTMTAFLDCVLGVYTIVATLTRMVVPFTAYDGSIWCQINFVFSRVLVISCLNLIMLLSLVRYSVIVFFFKSHPRFWAVVAILSIAAITAATNFRLYSAKLYIFPSRLYCNPIDLRPRSIDAFSVKILLLFSFPPLLIIPFCYGCVSLHYARLLRSGEDHCMHHPMRRKILGIALVALAYSLAVVPHLALFVAVRLYKYVPSPTLDGLTYILFTCISLINGIFPIVLHSEIKEIVFDMFFPKGNHSKFPYY